MKNQARFVLIVTASPYQHQATNSALNFARALLAEGHILQQVFFYQDGVYNASRLSFPPQDDQNLLREWSQLATEHHVDLAICSAAGMRRGVIDWFMAKQNFLTVDNLAPAFRSAGLGQFAEAIRKADRVITFNH